MQKIKKMKSVNNEEFRLMLIKDLIENESNQQLNIILDPEINIKNRLKERHFLEEIQDGRRDCYICSDRTIKSIRTYYQCKFCEIALCLTKCFEIFHTKKDSYKLKKIYILRKKTEYLRKKKILTKLIWAHIWAQKHQRVKNFSRQTSQIFEKIS